MQQDPILNNNRTIANMYTRQAHQYKDMLEKFLQDMLRLRVQQ